jgi:hypothetical protein
VDVLVAQIVPQREQIEIEKNPGSKRSPQPGRKLQATLGKEFLFQVRVLSEIIQQLVRQGRIVVKNEPDC